MTFILPLPRERVGQQTAIFQLEGFPSFKLFESSGEFLPLPNSIDQGPRGYIVL